MRFLGGELMLLPNLHVTFHLVIAPHNSLQNPSFAGRLGRDQTTLFPPSALADRIKADI
jgi:hypothetical protein